MNTKNTIIIFLIIILVITFLYIYRNLIFDYLLLINLILVIFPGSYAINSLVSKNTYWNYLSQITLKNTIIYKNDNVISKLNNGYIIISNHINVSDVLLIRNKLDCFVVAKDSIISKEYSYLNFIDNIFFTNLDLIPYKRKSIASGKIVKEKILELTSNKINVLIFPEGTSQKNCHNGILPFKNGIFHLAYEHNIKILPIVLYYTDKNYGLDKETVFSPSDILKNNCKIYVNFLNPFEPQKFSDTNKLVKTIYNKMNSTILYYNNKINKIH
jgi:1-acyl-sn-glycerol-3-phosphate acyltransferase